MSLNAVLWAISLPRDVLKGGARDVLNLIANYARPEGTSAWPSQIEIAQTLGITERSVRRHLAQLEAAGLIRRGDQRVVEHLRGDRRPVVWDLAMTPRAAGRKAAGRGDRTVPPDTRRPGADGSHGGTPAVRHGGTPPVLENQEQNRHEPERERRRAPAAVATEIPDSWSPSERHRQHAQRRGVDVDDAAEAFEAHARANGRRLVDWDAGFDFWLTRARPPAPPPPTRASAGPPQRSTREERLARADEAAERVAQMQHEQRRHLVGVGGGV